MVLRFRHALKREGALCLPIKNCMIMLAHCFCLGGLGDSISEALEAFEAVRDYPGADVFIERCKKLLSWKVGSVVEFGAWNNQPMTWKVLESFDKERLLFANQLVGPSPYTDARRISYWEDSDLRRWLNGSFKWRSFSLEERAHIIPTPLKNEPNPVVFSQNGKDTVDKIYVFGHQEIEARRIG